MWNLRFRASGSGFRIWGFRVLGFRTQLKMWVLGFRIYPKTLRTHNKMPMGPKTVL